MYLVIQSYKRATRVVDFVGSKSLAHYTLWTMYEAGESVKPDHLKALENYKYSADFMNHDALWKVPLWLESGVCVQKNIVRAVDYFFVAAS